MALVQARAVDRNTQKRAHCADLTDVPAGKVNLVSAEISQGTVCESPCPCNESGQLTVPRRMRHHGKLARAPHEQKNEGSPWLAPGASGGY